MNRTILVTLSELRKGDVIPSFPGVVRGTGRIGSVVSVDMGHGSSFIGDAGREIEIAARKTSTLDESEDQ